MKKFLVMFSLAGMVLFGSSTGAFAASNTYKVKSGDSLYRIAKTYKISVSSLKKWNNLKSNTIHPNQTLKITSGTASKPAVKAKTTTTNSKKLKVVKTITVKATAYTANCKRCSGITALGLNLKKNPNLKVISVDPKVIKLGTKVYVEGYGYAIAGDTGGAIRGKKIDIFVPSYKKAIQWGRKTVKVQILK
ncbi:LysM peptidoglycan-binding domain-containing protein [Bacillus sp. sid0103]|uniref:3D domain-containing protein n=1 Tax=Bacillus sp. sid0103 TaxID=2856337 RepID=UPI001C491902|nr:3D domain-containing protein [Bacillus sp. sid0103]MBV7505698.1 LysM peptidoglycan-binding domain-containing protein [Bacillus sp. sid0103]